MEVLRKERVLYEDNHLIAVNKLPGEITQGDSTGDPPMTRMVAAFLKEKYGKPGNVFCGLIHRLDRPASGVTLFAKTSKALGRMNRLFQEHDVRKTYWAVVKGPPQGKEVTLVHHLVRDRAKNRSRAHDRPQGGSKRAELHLRTLARSGGHHLLEINPVTGRHHQIRAQLQAVGCFIRGDLKYGAAVANPDASIHLHARRLEFTHPVKGTPVCITAPPPREKLWIRFAEMVRGR